MEKGDLLRRRHAGVPRTDLHDALDAAHGENIVHRDLKPEERLDRDAQARQALPVKLLDFGIAKLLSSGERSTTQTRDDHGHAAPLSPEQCHGKAVDHRTDIYAMGVMLYQLYSGRLPFTGETFAEILAKQIIDTPEPPSKYAQIPAELDRLIVKCLSKDPGGRPQTAKELGLSLASILAGAAARVQRAAGQPTSATTLSASAVEVRRRQLETEVAPSARAASGPPSPARPAPAAAVDSRDRSPRSTPGAAARPGRRYARRGPGPGRRAPPRLPPAAPPPAAPVAPPVAPPPAPPTRRPPADGRRRRRGIPRGRQARRGAARSSRRPSAPARPPARAPRDTGSVTHSPVRGSLRVREDPAQRGRA